VDPDQIPNNVPVLRPSRLIGTAVRVCSARPRLYTTVAVVINMLTGNMGVT